MELRAASTLDHAELTTLFNAGFADYVVPLRVDEDWLREHLEVLDVDLAASRIAVDERPVAFALVSVRAADAWIAGMGTALPARRRGLGEAVLRAALDAASERGCGAVWLEVIDRNEPAIRLYEKLGFEAVRDLEVWSLPATERAAARGVGVDEAHAWIAGQRPSREPWQRDDVTLARLRERGADLRGLAVDRDDAPAAVVLYRLDTPVVQVVQLAAANEESAAGALLATAALGKDVRLTNVPAGEPPALALDRLGARLVARQHELRLPL
jgi:ribosomal protein S18 acetylase RimI-like enzyme